MRPPRLRCVQVAPFYVARYYTRSSQMVKGWIHEHDLVISKGQGNYEGLSEHNRLFFMLIAKCPIIASDLGVEVGDIILKYKQ